MTEGLFLPQTLYQRTALGVTHLAPRRILILMNLPEENHFTVRTSNPRAELRHTRSKCKERAFCFEGSEADIWRVAAHADCAREDRALNPGCPRFKLGAEQT